MGHGQKRAGKRRVLTPLACCLSAVCLAACGGTQSDAVVRVNGTPITKAEVDHWMSAVAGSASTEPGQSRFAVPQPPTYAACISYLEKHPSFGALAEPVKPTRAARRAKCEFEYRKEQLKSLYTLISFHWVLGEAAELGVKVAPAELNKVLASFAHQSFPNGETFHEYLTSMRQTLADFTMLIKQELLVTAVHRKLEAQPSMQRMTPQQRQRALTSFGEQYERKWRQRTDCQAGYVVPICRQYRTPKTPPTLVPNAIPLTDLAAE